MSMYVRKYLAEVAGGAGTTAAAAAAESVAGRDSISSTAGSGIRIQHQTAVFQHWRQPGAG
jgi:hypothetical protein